MEPTGKCRRRRVVTMTDAILLERFVGAFGALNEGHLYVEGVDEISAEMNDGFDDSKWARQKWKPVPMASDPGNLRVVFEQLPARLPPLYEQLVLNYRWMRVELADWMSLFANPPGGDFSKLIGEMTRDSVLTSVLFPNGLLPFGRAPDDNYDPICFDTRRRLRDGDCPVVRVDHEEILCHLRMGRVVDVSESFRGLVEAVVQSVERSG
jgi:hypothetical protein